MRKYSLLILAALSAVMLAAPMLGVSSGGSNASARPDPSPDKSVSDHLTAVGDGYFNVLDTATGSVSRYSDREYLFGAVGAEMPASYPVEALKAQAVAAYTVACLRRESERKHPTEGMNGADLTSDSKIDQAFKPRDVLCAGWGAQAEKYEQKLDAVIDSVLYQVLSYDGRLAEALYHAISNGRTETAMNVWGKPLPYLTAKDSAGDLTAAGYLSEVRVTAEEFKKKAETLGAKLEGDDPQKWLGTAETSDSGTVLGYTFGGVTVTGKQMRSAFDLRSATFELAFKDKSFVFTVRGYGHGVGMSQYGAKCMAESGEDYRAILEYYYTGCRITDLFALKNQGQ